MELDKEVYCTSPEPRNCLMPSAELLQCSLCDDAQGVICGICCPCQNWNRSSCIIPKVSQRHCELSLASNQGHICWFVHQLLHAFNHAWDCRLRGTSEAAQCQCAFYRYRIV